jgi:hypothetical protein
MTALDDASRKFKVTGPAWFIRGRETLMNKQEMHQPISN